MTKIKFGIIGVGGMGTGHAHNITERVEEAELVAVADISPEALKDATETFGVKGFSTGSDLINSGLVDAVVIATPHYYHPPLAIEAMRAGLHVVSEKPMAVRASKAREMIQVAEETGQLLTIRFQLHGSPAVQAARKLIDEGKLGEIYRTLLVEGRFRSQSYYDSATWRATWKGEGGGVLMNQAPHWVDIFTWLGGLPVKVYGQCIARQHKIEVEDEATAMLWYDNGAIGLFHESVNELPTSSRLELLGEKGKLVIEDGTLRFWEVPAGVKAFSNSAANMWAKAEWNEIEIELPEDDDPAPVVRNMCYAITKGAPLLVDPKDALLGLELIDALMISSDLGQPVDVPVDPAVFDAFIERKQGESQEKEVSGPYQRVTDPNLK